MAHPDEPEFIGGRWFPYVVATTAIGLGSPIYWMVTAIGIYGLCTENDCTDGVESGAGRVILTVVAVMFVIAVVVGVAKLGRRALPKHRRMIWIVTVVAAAWFPLFIAIADVSL